MGRTKQAPRHARGPKAVPTSSSSPSDSTSQRRFILETPEGDTLSPSPNKHVYTMEGLISSPLSSVPPTSPAAPTSPKTNSKHIADSDDSGFGSSPPRSLGRSNGVPAIEPNDTPKALPQRTERTPQPTCTSRESTPDELHAPDAISTTSSKRKCSCSPLPCEPPLRAKRSRASADFPPIKLRDEDFCPPYTPLTAEEKQAWKGWVEVESEPIYMNTMLRSLGVQGVRAEEIHDLEYSIGTLEGPIYGLIFLFQYQDSDHIAGDHKCPENVWFANQLPATNACATIALINILMNVKRKGVELGKALKFLKEDTSELTPMERAHCINEHEFIRGVHNSHASRVDMWLADRIFAGKYKRAVLAKEKKERDEERAKERAEKDRRKQQERKDNPETVRAEARPKRKTKATAKRKNKSKYCEDTSSGDEATSPEKDEDKNAGYNDESGYHYVAYVPIDGHIWYLDGMSAHPQDIGQYTHPDMWLFDTAPHIQNRMAMFADFGAGISFNLMTLVKDPATKAREELAGRVKMLLAVEEKLDALSLDWRTFAGDIGEDVLRGSDVEVGLTQAMLDGAASPAPEVLPSLSVEKLLYRRSETAREQAELRETIRVQAVKEANEDLKVAKDRLDLNPMIQRVLMDLEENGEMGMLDGFRET